MSIKLFNKAIEAFVIGDTTQAFELFLSIDHQFLKKRLATSACNGQLLDDQVIAIYKKMFENENISTFQTLIKTRSKSVELSNGPKVQTPENTTYSPPTPSRKIDLSSPEEFLHWLTSQLSQGSRTVNLDGFSMIQPWGLVALATIARHDGNPQLQIDEMIDRHNNAGRFALSLGLVDVLEGKEAQGRGEKDRTVKLRRINDFSRIESISSEISHLIVSNSSEEDNYLDREEVRRVIYYVLVELMRNVLQHSKDPLGGIVVAQSMNMGGVYEKQPSIQVAVGDQGIGIFDALKAMHSEIEGPRVALERALWPHYSGAFDETKKGSSQNAGLGLFFISEMAKMSGGRLLVASRGDALNLIGDNEGHGSIGFLNTDYPGTLVVFEIPKRGIADYDALNRLIIERAEERTTKRHDRKLLRYDFPPPDTFEVTIRIGAEDTVKAENLSTQHLIPRLKLNNAIVLNFNGIDLCTQSFVHALLFEALRVAWPPRVPIYIKNASEAVKDSLRLVQMYALSDME